MKTINEITRENFEHMFDVKDILEESVFYPASGTDGTPIQILSNEYHSFIHVDYSIPKNEVETRMKNDFQGVGYDLIGIKYVRKEELTPNGFSPLAHELTDFEKERLKRDFIRDKYQGINFTPFALWAVYELNPTKTNKTQGKVKRFSLLHIGGEACATFEALYVQNKINPSGVVILYSGSGFGDNWTRFIEPECRFYQLLRYNVMYNDAKMPNILLTNESNNNTAWPDYTFRSEKVVLYNKSVRYISIFDLN